MALALFIYTLVVALCLAIDFGIIITTDQKKQPTKFAVAIVTIILLQIMALAGVGIFYN